MGIHTATLAPRGKGRHSKSKRFPLAPGGTLTLSGVIGVE